MESCGLAPKINETPTCTRTCIKTQCGIFAIGAKIAEFLGGCRRSENETESYGLDNVTGATSNGSTEEGRFREESAAWDTKRCGKDTKLHIRGLCRWAKAASSESARCSNRRECVHRIGKGDEIKPAYPWDWESPGAEV
ncbi:hypothetical protein N7463_001459 [Penicillium fimorum]|uniref:Uncharacterized protein n=1 Tax=Penicillium fimorum TaxID=1882269 RepID=A0A9X0CBV5_9EURO|nr:hypothetical protein N7463_001459 [Penicillium fimorum]